MQQAARTSRIRVGRKASAPLQIVTAAWLSDTCLVAILSHATEIGHFDRASLLLDGGTLELGISSIRHPADGPERREDSIRSVFMFRLGRSVRERGPVGLTLSVGTVKWRIDSAAVGAALTDLRALIRSQFTALDAPARGQVVRFLVAGAGQSDPDHGNCLRESRGLHVAREMLRERLPTCELSAGNMEGFSVEALVRVSARDFYVEGWICDAESVAVRLTAVSPEGARAELISHLHRYDRPDVQAFFKPTIGAEASANFGFICFFKLDEPSRLPTGWVFEMETASGAEMEVAAPPVVTGDDRIRAKLLGDLGREGGDSHDLRSLHISPALSTLQAQRGARVRVEHEATFGQQPSRPQVSVIVPLYGRVDLMEHQVVQFAGDREMHRAELIYVLDSPERRSDVIAGAERLYRLYGLPMRVLVLSENAGFSLANNLAASLAGGRLLVLLNSDVLPRHPGWVTQMAELYDSLDRPGAAGPMLLYEDDSLQHAGLYFDRPAASRLWSNEHYFKGLHMDLPAANIPREVPAVTAACLMVDAELYRQVGGLSGAYVQGDYEDSDLCLRLRDAGRRNWYLPQVRLYHLEAQSYPSSARNVNREYNRWLFNETWGDVIAQLPSEEFRIGISNEQANGTGSAVEAALDRAEVLGQS
jgi:GT2 family glycosyltransferase